MKKVFIISGLVLFVAIIGCSDVKRHPGRVYMPDMGNSVAYETYVSTANLDSAGINYTRMPVPGTIKRGELFPFPIAKDAVGDSTNYVASRQVVSPLKALTAVEMKEAERLYLVNCGICHGTALDGQGPLHKDGGPYSAAPKNLVTLDMPDGQMFYSITYGKNQMGPYGPQLNTKQRWMIVSYINSKQGDGGTAPAADSTAAPAKDSAATAKK